LIAPLRGCETDQSATANQGWVNNYNIKLPKRPGPGRAIGPGGAGAAGSTNSGSRWNPIFPAVAAQPRRRSARSASVPAGRAWPMKWGLAKPSKLVLAPNCWRTLGGFRCYSERCYRSPICTLSDARIEPVVYKLGIGNCRHGSTSASGRGTRNHRGRGLSRSRKFPKFEIPKFPADGPKFPDHGGKIPCFIA
jgi:hypothetical protein